MVQPERDPAAPPGPEHLAPTRFIDSEHATVQEFARQASAPAGDDDRERIRLLFAAVRDRIRYNPYGIVDDPDGYVASNVIDRESAYCIPKAVVLTASARALGIPARLGFADVRNHLQSERLAQLMGTDVFVFHGYSELFVDGAWRKATPAFNAELCARFGVPPLEFDGTDDALLHAFTGDGARHMEYIRDHGSYSELPFAELLEALRSAYPRLLGPANESDRAPEDPAFAP